VYTDFNWWKIYYATNKSGSWVTKDTGAFAYQNGGEALAIDSSGNVYLALSARSPIPPNYMIQFGVYNGSSWSFEMVTDIQAGKDSDYLTLGIFEAAGKAVAAHLTWHEFSGNGHLFLRYATNKSGSWVVGDVISSGDQDHIYPNIVVDGNGVPHIVARFNWPTMGLTGVEYFTRNGGSWIGEDVTAGDGDVALALDSGNAPHLMYMFDDSSLYAYHGPAGWLEQIIFLGSPDQVWGFGPNIYWNGGVIQATNYVRNPSSNQYDLYYYQFPAGSR
jgi:hypothetical protein